jgi:hypothetical protein
MRVTVTAALGAGAAGALGAQGAAPRPSAQGVAASVTLRFDRMIRLEETSETSANVSLGDVNADGHLDVLLVKGRHWPLDDLVLVGDGTGRFQPPRPLATPDRSYSGVLVDLDGDGDLDVVVSNDLPDVKRVYLNDGRGSFTAGSEFGKPEWPTRHVRVADMNADGLPDIIVANRIGDLRDARSRAGTQHSFVCFNLGAGRFDSECHPFSQESATTVTPADFDRDGLPDLVVPHRDGGQSYVYLNDRSSPGTFIERVPFGPPDATIRSAEAGDFDGDGVTDVVVIDERTGPAIWWGAPGRTFADVVPLGPPGVTPYALAVSDVDRDGRPDILVGYVEAPSVVLFNRAPRSFEAVSFGDSEGTAYGFSVGDVDEDGILDIALARSDAPNVLFFGARGAVRP